MAYAISFKILTSHFKNQSVINKLMLFHFFIHKKIIKNTKRRYMDFIQFIGSSLVQ